MNPHLYPTFTAPAGGTRHGHCATSFMRIVLAVMLCAMCRGAMANGILPLNSSDTCLWQIFRAGVLRAKDVSKAGYVPDAWVPGIVPGTVFAAYVADGQEDNPSYGDNIYRVDETLYNRTFWYRTEFARPDTGSQRAVLVLEGINRTAEVWFNGKKLGTVKGHVVKARYDITPLLADHNALAVKVSPPASQYLPRTANYVNYVCPTYVASHSWDWMPYVPGLNTGITNDVYIELAGEVSLRDPWTRSTLSLDNAKATLHQQTALANLSDHDMEVTVRATVTPGGTTVSRTLTVEAGSTADVTLPDMAIDRPLLWWPNGMGAQNMYTARYEVVAGGRVIDVQDVPFGIRRYTYAKENTAMVLRVNGKKVYCKGGNWGMSDYMLQCHGDEYDLRLKLHRDMHYNMIRLWTGCVTDEEFYDACDRYGIMVWDDFWLTGAYTGLTGPNSADEFTDNARHKVIRLRNHPCIAVWCGCNEGWPYDELNNSLKNIIGTYDADDRAYLPNSHNGYATRQQYDAQDGSGLGLSGSGWWTNFPPADYFSKGIWGGGGDLGDRDDWGFRTELGMGAFTTFESFKEFMPEQYWWPRNEMWEKHFFSDDAAYGGAAGASKYFSSVEQGYGPSNSAQQFCEKAQLLNIEVMKAMYEGWQDNLWNTATGLLFWMSQPAYPCFIWQTYDYYYDATGTYWGAKKACEPQHIQWNCANGNVNVVNTSGTDLDGATACIEVRRLDGSRCEPLCTTVSGISAPAGTVTRVLTLDHTAAKGQEALKGMFFIRLSLDGADGQHISDNFYWTQADASRPADYTQLNTLPHAHVTGTILSLTTDGNATRLQVKVENPSTAVAFAVRLRLADKLTGKRILPVIMPDNYITLMPGESRELYIEYDNRFNSAVQPVLMLKPYGQDETVGGSTDGIAALQHERLQPRLAMGAPVGDVLHVGLDDSSVQNLTVTALDGSVAARTAGHASVNVSHLPSGLYIVTARTTGGHTLKGKMVKK